MNPASLPHPQGLHPSLPGPAVRQMFTAIARRYDLLNRLLSLGLDQLWRKAMAGEVAAAIRRGGLPPGRILDLATGTGDVLLALDRRIPRGWSLIGADFTPAMLAVARGKLAAAARPFDLVGADAYALPFPSKCFTFATIAFGLRNMADRGKAFSELHRVLTAGGVLLVLELSPGTPPLLAPLFRLWSHLIGPRLGGFVSGHPDAYRYLPRSVDAFPLPGRLADEMSRAGFVGIRVRSFALGAARLHAGVRPP